MIFLSVLIGILVIPIVILAVPIEIEYKFDSQARQKSRTRIIWLFGLVKMRVSDNEDKRKRSKIHRQVSVEKKGKKSEVSKSGKRSIRVVMAIIKTEGFLVRIFRFIYEVLTVAKIKFLRAKVSFGLEDPADTGRVYGLLAPAFSFIYAIPKVDFEAVPQFDGARFESSIETKIRVVPINYLKAALLLIFSKETLRAVRRAIKAY